MTQVSYVLSEKIYISAVQFTWQDIPRVFVAILTGAIIAWPPSPPPPPPPPLSLKWLELPFYTFLNNAVLCSFFVQLLHTQL